MYGIRITINGSIDWIVGKDSDMLLFPDKAAASTALKRLKSGDAYSWNWRSRGFRVPRVGEEVNQSAV